MFKNRDFYDLDAAMQTLNDRKMVLELRLQIEALKLLLDKKGIASPADIEAVLAYLQTTPEIRAINEAIAAIEANIQAYKNDPQAHLKALSKAKIDGNIR